MIIIQSSPSLEDSPDCNDGHVLLRCPRVAEERSYSKNAVSISTKLFPLNSLSQYWARLFVLFQ